MTTGTTSVLRPHPAQRVDEVLIRADRASVIATLARGMAHDFRGPLQTLTLLVDPHADFLGAESSRLQAAVHDAVRDLAGTISRFSSLYGPLEANPAPVIVEDLLAFVADLQRYQRGLSAVDLVVRSARGFPPVRGVEGHLRHALLSLIINAKQALDGRPDGEVLLTPELVGESIQIVAEDNGPGVPAGEESRIFEPRYTTKPEALGLGLPVARHLIERDGGTLTAERRSLKPGGRFVVTLRVWRGS